MLNTIIIFGLYAIALVAPTQYSFPVSGIHLTLVDPLIWGLAGLWMINCVIQKSFVKMLPSLFSVGLVVLMSLSIINAVSIKDSAKELIQLIEYFVLSMILFTKVDLSDKQRGRLLACFSLSFVVCVLMGVGQYFSGSIESVLDVKAGFGNRNVFGGFLAICFPFFLSLILGPMKFTYKLVLGLSLLLALITLLSGGAFVALSIGTFAVAALHSRRAIVATSCMIVVFVLLVWPSLPRANDEVLVESTKLFKVEEEVAVESRYTEWEVAISMWQEQPWIGVGLGNYQQEIGQYYGFLPDPQGPQEADRNNIYFVILSSTGILGLMGLFMWIMNLFKSHQDLMGIANDKWVVALARGALGSLIAFCIVNLWSSMIVRGVMIPFIIIQCFALYHMFAGKKQLSS